LILVALFALVAVPPASAKRLRFSVSVEGAVQLSWAHEATYRSGGCEVSSAESGSESVEFRSTRPSIVTAIASGRRVRSLAATLVSLTGPVAGGGGVTTQTCGLTVHADLACGSGPFEGAIRLTRAEPGRLRLAELTGEGLPDPRCIPQALAPPEFPPLSRALGRLDERKLLNPRVKTFSVTGRDDGVVRLAAEGETGSLSRHVSWKLTFRRLGR
jgi:hypothetical protein